MHCHLFVRRGVLFLCTRRGKKRRNAAIGDYRVATGFEALFGCWYLRGTDRADAADGKDGNDVGNRAMRYEELTIEGRNAVPETFRSGKMIDRLLVAEGNKEGAVSTV